MLLLLFAFLLAVIPFTVSSKNSELNQLPPRPLYATPILPIETPLTAHEQMLKDAGIAKEDWFYADFIIMHEGSYDPCKVNGGAHDCNYPTISNRKAYGVCQALPGIKMASIGESWQIDPVKQLKWCQQYAFSSHGGTWQSNYQFWILHRYW